MRVKQLSAVRVDRGYSIKEVADRIGIGWLALREYETMPYIIPVSVANEIAKFYRLSVDEIDFGE